MIGANLIKEVEHHKQLTQYSYFDYAQQSNKIYAEELNIDKLCIQLQYESNIIDTWISMVLMALKESFKNPASSNAINQMLSYLGIIDKSNPNYHEAEFDTSISKSIDVNIKGFERSLDICNKYKDLSIKEKELIQDETKLTLSLLNHATKNVNSFNIQYKGLSLDQLSKLFKGITNANEKFI